MRGGGQLQPWPLLHIYGEGLPRAVGKEVGLGDDLLLGKIE